MMIILFVSHVLGDYYFQGNVVAKKKQSNFWILLLHCAIYALTFVALTLAVYENVVLWPVLFVCVSHLLVDLISSGIIGIKIFPKNIFLNHLFDQLMHYAFMIALAILFSSTFIFRSWVTSFLAINTFTGYGMATIFFIGCILFLLKPIKLLVDDILLVSVGEQLDLAANTKSIYLGYLERILTFLSLVLGTWLVLSVLIGFKTWAQSERLKKESDDFPKRYIIGTISSIIPAIFIAMIFIWYMNQLGLPLVQIPAVS